MRADWRTVLCGGAPKDCHSRWDPRKGLGGFFCCLLSDCSHCHPKMTVSTTFQHLTRVDSGHVSIEKRNRLADKNYSVELSI